MAKVNLNHISIPNTEKHISEEAKSFTEKWLLNRNVQVTLEKVDDYKNILGRVSHP